MKIYYEIPPHLSKWAQMQLLFFVGSAPLTGKHVNCSPKGIPNASFKIFDSTTCAYIDYTGSGSETIAHCYENGRVTIMFCSFDSLPRILRFFCWGTVIERDDPRFDPMIKKMGKEKEAGQRAIIMLKVWKVTTSCGTGVPVFGKPKIRDGEEANLDSREDKLVLKDRAGMNQWCRYMEEHNKMDSWQRDYNADSLDGVPAMKWSRKAQGQWMLATDLKYAIRRSFAETYGMFAGFLLACMLIFLLNGVGLDSRMLLLDSVVGKV